jgi:HD-GYP domain-containing protein (c-di-GMP phosphodiesterase class II)
MVMVCDRCETERQELGTVSYRPRARRYVGHLVELTARELGLTTLQVARVRLAALICDMGRDEISGEILNKRGPLTPAEWVEVRRQPELAAAVLSDASFDDIRDWVLSHRERFDGTGYPRGLGSEAIPLEARILAVVEAYVAMTSPRPHRAVRGHEQAIAELLECGGSQFDPTVVAAFIRASAARSLQLAACAA